MRTTSPMWLDYISPSRMSTKNRQMVLAFCLFFGTTVFGQNLAGNYDFSFMPICCSNANCIQDWHSLVSPDLIHFCHPLQNGNGYNAPKSGYGFQWPYQGDGYLVFGFVNYGNNQYAFETPINHLKQSLFIDSSYCFKVMINPTDSTRALTSSFQVLFAVDSIFDPLPPHRLQRSVVQYNHPRDDYLDNFDSWRPITGNFIADSAYNYVAFGFFGELADYQWQQYHQGPQAHSDVSMFLDGVYVLPCSQVDSAEAGTGGFACLEENKSFELGVPNSDGHSWEWWPTIGLDNPNISNPVAHPFETTTYHLKMVNYMHDTLYDSVTIFIDVCQPKFPNIITPNGDLQNDAFEIENLPPGSSVKIFNQWGMEVFSSPNYQNNFDGTSSTGNLSEGVYYYTLEYDFLEERKDTTGYFHLFR